MKLLRSSGIGILFFCLYIQSVSAFSIEIPNTAIKEFSTLIKNHVQIQCEGVESKIQCIENEYKENGLCYLDINMSTAKNNLSCEVTNNNGKTKNTIQITKKDIQQIEKKVQAIEAEKKVFTTSDKFFKKHLQKYTYSCEVASTSDILSTIKNRHVTEEELIRKLSKSWFGAPAKEYNGKTVWGNPNKGFVGYIHKTPNGEDASQRKLTGYGVYEQPIANLYTRYGVKTKIINKTHHSKTYGEKEHLEEMLRNIEQGNFVQFWGDVCTDPQYEDGEINLHDITQEDIDAGKIGKNNCWSWGTNRKTSWYYQEKGKLKKHDALIGEHNFYLLGYRGPRENPNHIILWDTASGEHMYPIQEFIRKWKAMDYRSIIIYPDYKRPSF